MKFELNTAISNLRSLRESDLSSFDAVYLGNIYCRTFDRNFLECVDDLKEAIARVKDQGLRVYVSSYAAPRNDALPKIRKAVETAVESGADAIEVHNLGVLYMIHEQFPGTGVHMGGFANVYTDAGAAVMKQYGAVRFTPNYEISLDEIGAIVGTSGLPPEILIHGKMPLGVSDYCFLLEYQDKWPERCPDVCQHNLFLRQGDWALRTVGKGVLSGKDVCMLEHLPALLARGFCNFRIEAAYENQAYRRDIAKIYRDVLEGMPADDSAWEQVRKYTEVGICNGFYFGTSGGEYVGNQCVIPNAEATLCQTSVPRSCCDT